MEVSAIEELDGFELIREIGRGGSGIVYEALHHGATVALKIQRELDERERQRFVREAELMTRVSHAALVRLLGSGVSPDGRAYLVMDLLRGETLAVRLKRGPIQVEEAVRMFAPLAGAVQALHDAGFVHRDIKPENVMLAESHDGIIRPVLLDFGIVREVEGAASTTTAAGFVRGSRAYMAPERFFGQGASIASDVYELGVTLYMMLSGRLPWGEEDAAGSRLEPEELPRPSGRALSRVVMRAISTRPEQRHSTAAAFRDAVVDAAQAKSTPELPRTTDMEPVLREARDVSIPILVETDTQLSATAPATPSEEELPDPPSMRAPARRSALPYIFAAAALVIGAGGTVAWNQLYNAKTSAPAGVAAATTSTNVANATSGAPMTSAAPVTSAIATAPTSIPAPSASVAASMLGIAPSPPKSSGRVRVTTPPAPSIAKSAAPTATNAAPSADVYYRDRH